MAGEYPSDEQVHRAVDDFVDALERTVQQIYFSIDASPIERIEAFWKPPDTSAAREELAAACRPVLELHPDGFHSLADGLSRALRVLDEGEAESEGFFEGYRAAPAQLSGWHGEAADAFRSQVNHLGKFAVEQAKGMTRLAGCMLTAYQVSCLARTDLVTVLRTGADACRAMAATDSTQTLQAQLFVGAGLAAGTLNYLATPALVARALGAGAQTIGTTTTLVTAAISGGDPAQILDSVRRGQQGVVERMHDAYREIVRRTDDISRTGLQAPPALLDPLPASADVHDPAFRYEDFSSPWRSDSTYSEAVTDHAVTDQAATPAPPAPGETTTIRSALG